MRTRLSNQLKALLKSYFPQALELCGEDLTTPMACAFFCKSGPLSSSLRKRDRKPSGAFTTRRTLAAAM
jgi:hypothetical protein